MGKHPYGRLALLGGEPGKQLGGEIHLEQIGVCPLGEALGGIRLAVAVGDIGLDVENRRPIHQVGAAHMQHRAVFFGVLRPNQPDAGEPQIVGAEGRACGKYAHADVAPQPWRPYRR